MRAQHRSVHEPHTLRRGAATPEGDRGEEAQGAVRQFRPLRFVPSPVWKGARPGYMFGRGVHGQGYYADFAQGERWRESQAADSARAVLAKPRGRHSRSRSRSRSRERRTPRDKPVPAAFDASKLEGSLPRKHEKALTEEQRSAAALARLAERRQAGAGARPGGHGGQGARW